MKDWLKAAESVPVTEVDKVPEGWITKKQFAAIIGMSDSHATKKMAALVRDGKVESRRFRIKAGQRVYPIDHYRLK